MVECVETERGQIVREMVECVVTERGQIVRKRWWRV